MLYTGGGAPGRYRGRVDRPAQQPPDPARAARAVLDRVQRFDADGVWTTAVGTGVFAVASVALAVGPRSLPGQQPTWLAVAVSGVALGLIGLVYCARRRRLRRAAV